MFDFSNWYFQAIVMTILCIPYIFRFPNDIFSVIIPILYVIWWIDRIRKKDIQLSLKYIVIPILFIAYYLLINEFPYMK